MGPSSYQYEASKVSSQWSASLQQCNFFFGGTCSNCSLGREDEAGPGGGESAKGKDMEVEVGEWHGEMMFMGSGNVGEELLDTW